MPEAVIFLLMILIFAILAMGLKLPIGVSLASAALAGALLGGEGFALRHLIEGAFGYFDTILIILTAMIFMKSIEAAGLLDTITAALLRTFYRRKISLLLTAMLLVMFPGMITGSSTTAVLTTGALIAPVLMKLGLSKIKTAAFIAMGGILGMIAPPVNILVMIMGSGVDMPYVGFTAPLLLTVMPLALLISLWIGYKDLHIIPFTKMKALLPGPPVKFSGLRHTLPLWIVFLLMISRTLPRPFIPDLGLPLIFMIGSLISPFCGRPFHIIRTTQTAVKEAVPILSILAGVGMFIQIMTLTGGRGWAVLLFLSLPPFLLYLGIGVSMPLFGAVSSFGSASILGVPFILALIDKNSVITASALSVIAGLGDLMPPTALAGIFAAQVVGENNYFKVLRACLVPALFELFLGIGVLLSVTFWDKIF